MAYCFYCGSVFDGHSFTAREMMFGTREQFEYAHCPGCRSCVLLTGLDTFDLSRHYPSDYYSFRQPRPGRSKLARFLKRRRADHVLGRANIIGATVARLLPSWEMRMLRAYGVALDSTILDVGCGGGHYLATLEESGFRGLEGCDPFIETEITLPNIVIKKCAIEDVVGSYDAIFFHHSFEHLADPPRSLAAARALQQPGGTCVVRVPTTSSLAFETYGPNWIQLDPPRHISVPSRDGMRKLASTCGYELKDMVDDSSAFQFWGSEQYLRDVPLTADDSYRTNPERSMFTKAEIDAFERKAVAANRAHQGDQTAFVLRAV